ncbi:glutamate synthase [NADPH], partial [Paramuricea clavata]
MMKQGYLLFQLIFNLKCSNPKSRISVKLVSEVGVGVIAAGVAKGHAEHIVISGHDGGTGASSWTGIKHAGLPWELGLSETHQTLVLNNLRRRVILQTDGQLRTGRDVVIAALLGADEFGFSTAPLISLGCTMMRKCHLNTCPVGIATQDPILRKKFDGKPEYVINYFFMIAEEVRDYMAQLGFKTVKEMIGQTQCIRQCDIPLNEKTKLLDFGKILVPARSLNDGEHYGGTEEQEFGLEDRMENELVDAVKEVLEGKRKNVLMELKIGNEDRSFGTTTSYHISRKLLDAGLPEDTVFVKLKGSAGQSFGAFICRGITLELEGDANDYVGKGLSGGKIILFPSENLPESFKAEENIIAGNVCLYGATSGKAYFRGVTAERFCVRNSGAVAVCEGCGDHGCEYMTGGTVVILGATGRNFAAGMSGGIAYIYDRSSRFPSLCNTQKVDLDPLQDQDYITLKHIIQDHFHYTQSTVAKTLLENWSEAVQYFIKVIPREYKLALQHQEDEEKSGENVVQQNGETEAIEEIPSRKDSVNEITDIEESVPNEIEDKNIDKQKGFVRYKRRVNAYRPAKKRVKDWNEIYNHPKEKELKVQTARCMDCGVPFCQSKTGCPLGNVIPKWNDLVFNGQWQDALDRLLQTNNFPEFTGRVCPAPCEGACVLSINSQPVTIKSIECKIIDVAFEKGWMKPQPPQMRTNKTVAIIGSGPAGLAAAAQLNKAGHVVTVYEKNDRCGGLLMYGIPSMKIEKEIVERRVNLLAEEGINFVPNTEVGKDISGQQLLASYDAILLAIGSTVPRDLQIP